MKPAYDHNGTTLYQGDCLEVMPHLPSGSIDLILCDLPYGTTDCAWDSVIPFSPLWTEYKRLIKPRGAIVLTAAQPFTTALIASNMAMFKYTWVWQKTRGSGFINAKNRPIACHEDICVFSSGTVANKSDQRMVYNPQGLVYAPFHTKRNAPMTAKKGGFLGTRPSHVASYDGEYQNYPRSVLLVPNPNNDNDHPTQKPVGLMEYLIQTYTEEGQTVLDNCFGSGTTAVACRNTCRRSIGIELNPAYIDIARRRLSQGSLFGMEEAA
jgi:site-specific DNA-methyltransferase (adenine-specific)